MAFSHLPCFTSTIATTHFFRLLLPPEALLCKTFVFHSCFSLKPELFLFRPNVRISISARTTPNQPVYESCPFLLPNNPVGLMSHIISAKQAWAGFDLCSLPRWKWYQYYIVWSLGARGDIMVDISCWLWIRSSLQNHFKSICSCQHQCTEH